MSDIGLPTSANWNKIIKKG